ncbi:MAG: hypothetical protein Tsb002_17960 [Wenzhouxiangellaceae bacterium]
MGRFILQSLLLVLLMTALYFAYGLAGRWFGNLGQIGFVVALLIAIVMKRFISR